MEVSIMRPGNNSFLHISSLWKILLSQSSSLLKLLLWILFVSGTVSIANSTSSAPKFTEKYVCKIVFSPNYANDHTVFATVWKSGLYKSIDQGNSWTRIVTSSDKDEQLYALAVSPSYGVDATLYAGFYDLNRSKDGGLNWKKITIGGERICDIDLSPNFQTDKTIYYIGFGQSMFNRNSNGGPDEWWDFIKWDSLGDGYLYNWCLEISPNFVIDSTLFIGRLGEGIRRSRDRGDTLDSLRLEDKAVSDIKISPNFAIDRTVFAATDEGLFKSVDGGDTWNALYSIRSREIAISPDFSKDSTIFLVTPYTLLKSTNGGRSWLSANSGISTPYISTIAISPNYASDQTLFAGIEESGRIFKTTNGGSSWFPASIGIQISTSPNLTNTPFIDDIDPSIVSDPDGTLHLAWLGAYADSSGIRQDIFYMKRKNFVWSNPILLSAPAGQYVKEFSLAVDRNSHPHIAFRSGTDNAFEEDDIYYNYDSGTGFLPEPILVVDGKPFAEDWEENLRQLSIAVDNSGLAHIAFITFKGIGIIWYTADANGAFSTPTRLTSEMTNATEVDIATDGNNKVHLAAAILDTGIVYINNAAGYFSEPITIFEKGGSNPIIALDSENSVHIAYYYFPWGGFKKVGYVTYKRGLLSTPQYIQDYHHPTMTLDSKGNVHIAAQRGPVWDQWSFYPNNEIGYANNLQGEFKDDLVTILNSGIATAERRYITVTPDDSVHIVYANGTLSGYDIYHLSLPADYLTSVTQKEPINLPESFVLYQNYPNPFNSTTSIGYYLPRPSKVLLRIYNTLGQEIRKLVNDFQTEGSKTVLWNGLDDKGQTLSSGIYIYTVIAGGISQSRKMLYIK
jgi:photosystem II stability/assembly factor-like uncharacterized protein